jgi:hypothetical protein
MESRTRVTKTPLSAFQREVLAAIVANRSEGSHFAGGLVLNAPDGSSRFSKDFDIFRDAAEDLATHSDRDVGRVTLDWAHDSAWRYFPIQRDELLGWKLHLFDVAVNKALALSARTETRDYIDILDFARLYSLEAIVWAACGKDEGFSPLFLLKMMRRFAKIEPGTLDKIKARDLDPIQMKAEWIEICDRAEEEMIRLADTQLDMPIGVAFVNEAGEPG